MHVSFDSKTSLSEGVWGICLTRLMKVKSGLDKFSHSAVVLEVQPVAEVQGIGGAGANVATVLDPASATVATTAGATLAGSAITPRTAASKAVVRVAALSVSPPQPSPRCLIKDPHFIVSDFDARCPLPLPLFCFKLFVSLSRLDLNARSAFLQGAHPLSHAVRIGSG